MISTYWGDFFIPSFVAHKLFNRSKNLRFTILSNFSKYSWILRRPKQKENWWGGGGGECSLLCRIKSNTFGKSIRSFPLWIYRQPSTLSDLILWPHGMVCLLRSCCSSLFLHRPLSQPQMLLSTAVIYLDSHFLLHWHMVLTWREYRCSLFCAVLNLRLPVGLWRRNSKMFNPKTLQLPNLSLNKE